MAQERLLDIINHVRAFYSKLSKYYDNLSDVADQERVKILLHYLSECEKRHEQALADYEAETPDGITETWFQYGTDNELEKCFETAPLLSDMDVDSVLAEALRLDECITNVYQEVIDRAQSDAIRDMFKFLLDSKQKERENLVRDTGHLQDW